MPSIFKIIGKDRVQVLKSPELVNFEKLYGRKYVKDEDVWAPTFAGFTHVEVGARMTVEVARSLGLVKCIRKWPDGREYQAVPLSIDDNGQIEIPKALSRRDDWFLMVKVVTRTATDRKTGDNFYTCCMTGNGHQLYKTDSERDDGTRSHSVAYYKKYGQMSSCRAGTEDKVVNIRPMNLIHLLRDKESPELIKVVCQKLMVQRRKDRKAGWQYKLSLTHLCQFTVEEKDPGDDHGIRILPADIKRGLTGQYEMLTSAVRDTYRVLTGEVELPLYADQFDPHVELLWGGYHSNLKRTISSFAPGQ